MTIIGVLALQGDFAEHQSMLQGLGADVRAVRTAEQLRGLDGLVIPGGESTTFCRLMEDYRLYEPLEALVRSGLPSWGTCAGMIVLARQANGLPFPTLQALDIEVDRNAYGRQVDSFEADIDSPEIGDGPFHAVFIRAPVVVAAGPAVKVLASCRHGDNEPARPVALRQGNVLATSFHPELTTDNRFHAYFLAIVRDAERVAVAK
jgi:5'-phosphate synthase pdxT subunit